MRKKEIDQRLKNRNRRCKLKEGTQEIFMLAFRDVAKAKGISKLAKEADLNRETMYRMLSEKGNPNLSSLKKVLNSLELTLIIGRKDNAA